MLEDALEDILDIATGGCCQMTPEEKLTAIEERAAKALINHYARGRKLKRMTREAQEAGLYDE